eukprot:CAMPEP_0113485098 /NCGR_PEP_ID=MMETSP0014_2-20120614/24308_1 /TAXON_ID=2857 /ORGANISM="Nitzschia sp." /LENGTH=291 /DNA_ID=CAMNT_0000378733 /DNA_START=144 /DNA_END=1019 /DNA_ORIENTATION=+ /assembly_acc=CAM_ASM_000159
MSMTALALALAVLTISPSSSSAFMPMSMPMPATTATLLIQKSNSSMRRLATAVEETAASFSEPSSSSSSTTSSSPQLPPIETAPAADHPLIQAAHKFAYSQSGFYSPYDESMFSDEFVFRGPYIGPLNKQDYFSTMDTFGIYKAFPDISPNCFGYSIDPQNPNRVWFMVRNTGTFTGEPGLGFGGDAYFPPNGATLQGSPETFSIIFDEDQKVKHLTVGYVADRFEGNTAGKGAAVGIFHVIGLPFPSPGPGLKLAQWLGTEVANMGAKSYSTENIPSWWKSEEKASEGYI